MTVAELRAWLETANQEAQVYVGEAPLRLVTPAYSTDGARVVLVYGETPEVSVAERQRQRQSIADAERLHKRWQSRSQWEAGEGPKDAA